MELNAHKIPDIVEVGPESLEDRHICCAIGSNKEAKGCAEAKKTWMRTVFPDGYHFWRLDAQGKAFIEVLPAEAAWAPLSADGWLFIDCFWVSGQWKGQGFGKALWQKALTHAKAGGFKGLVAVAGDQKRPFLSDGSFYRHLGFALADSAPPNYDLLAYPLDPGAKPPRFLDVAKTPRPLSETGFVIYYSNHCPHPSKYVPLLAGVAGEFGVPFAAHLLTSAAEARQVPNAFPTYALFFNGKFVTNELFSERKMRKFLEERA